MKHYSVDNLDTTPAGLVLFAGDHEGHVQLVSCNTIWNVGFPPTSAAPNTSGPYVAVQDGWLDGVSLTATAPVGSDVVCDVLRSRDGGSTWASIWGDDAAAKPRIKAGATSDDPWPDPSITFATGDRL